LAHDDKRTAYFRSLGIRVLRFNNREVLTETQAVLDTILRAVSNAPSP
jgi:very-short-patch-repair endonuclease